MKLVQNSVQQKADNAMQQAAHHGVTAPIDCYNEIAVDQSHIGEIIAYCMYLSCLRLILPLFSHHHHTDRYLR